MCFFFWSNEYTSSVLEPIHIHVCKGRLSEHETKIWIKADGTLELCHNNSKLSDKELSRAFEYIQANRNSIIAAWYTHFGM